MSGKKRLVSIAAVVLALAVLALSAFLWKAQPRLAASKAYRAISISNRAYSFSKLESTALSSKEDYAAFLKRLLEQSDPIYNPKLAASLEGAGIDFSTEALVLLTETMSSGSVEVTFLPPELSGDVLACAISRRVPEVGTMDMAYYCFALAVDRSKVKTVVWGKRTLSIDPKAP